MMKTLPEIAHDIDCMTPTDLKLMCERVTAYQKEYQTGGTAPAPVLMAALLRWVSVTLRASSEEK